jgi:hypothetical protein
MARTKKSKAPETAPLPGQAELPFEEIPNNPFSVLLDPTAPAPPQELPEPASTAPEPVPEQPAPLIHLGADAYADLVQPSGTFSDEPPPDWVEPVSSPQVSDPVAAARESLQADAARALGGETAKAPTVVVQVTRKSAGASDIRQALARAAASKNSKKYRSRVTIGMAYQYDGKLHQAPDWVDRNWAAWDEGPAINVPDVGIVRSGQWIVTQSVLNNDETVNFTEIKVYDDSVFQGLFMAEPAEPSSAK